MTKPIAEQVAELKVGEWVEVIGWVCPKCGNSYSSNHWQCEKCNDKSLGERIKEASNG